MAAKVDFSGSFEADDAPITLEAVKKKGRFRKFSVIAIGDSTNGIDQECDSAGVVERSYEYGGPLKIEPDGKFDNDAESFHIKGKLTSNRELKGTLELNGPQMGDFCTTNGPLKFAASR